MEPYEHLADRSLQSEATPTFWIPFLLLLQGFLLLLGAVILFPPATESLLQRKFDSIERFQMHLMQLGLVCSALLVLGWSFYEFVFRRSGPLFLLSSVVLFPVLAPFLFLGYGSDHDAWSVAFTALRIRETGEYMMSRPPGFPLFEGLASLLVPGGGWPLLLLVNALAGFLGAMVWLALPSGIPVEKRRLISVGILVQPLFLLGCGVGLDYIWQMTLVGAAVVFLLRGIHGDPSSALKWTVASGVALGLASGFRITSIVGLPVLAAAALLGRGSWMSAITRTVCFVLSAVVISLICELPVLLNFGAGALRVHPDHPHPVIVAYRLIRYVFHPPAILLLAVALVCLFWRWKGLARPERLLLGIAAGFLAVFLPGFLALPREPGYLTLLVPFFAVIWALLVPRGCLCIGLPAIAVWCFLSVHAVKPTPGPTPELSLRPSAGPVVEEAAQRFRNLRRAQRVLMAAPKKKTAVIVGFDWTMLATFRPDWVEGDDPFLVSPSDPVEFYDWIDPKRFQEMKSEGYRFLVVGDAARFTKIKYGYDLFAEGATEWNPKMRFYR